MCDPVSATLALTAAAGGMQAYGQYQQGKTEAKVARMNGKLADAQAEDRRRIGMIEEQRVRNQTRAALGTQRATLAANGVDTSSGSALDIQTSTASMGEQDAYLARSNALREAWGLNVEASNSRSRARMAGSAGRSAAFGTVLASGANAFGTYAKFGSGAGP